MGDAFTTPLDVVGFFLIFAEIPFLVLGLPIVVLGLLSARRTMSSNRKRKNESLVIQ